MRRVIALLFVAAIVSGCVSLAEFREYRERAGERLDRAEEHLELYEEHRGGD